MANRQTIVDSFADVVVVHQGHEYQGWSAVEKYLGDLLRQSAEIHLKVSDVNVVSLGTEGAVATANLAREISDGVTKVEEEGKLTLAFRLEKNRWVIVSEHFSYSPVTP